MVRKLLELPVKPGQNGLRRLSPCQLIDNPAVSKQIHDRNSAYTESPRKSGVFLGIDLNHGRFSRQQFRRFSHRRRE